MEKQELILKLKEIMPVMDMVDSYNKKTAVIERRIAQLNVEANQPYSFKLQHIAPGAALGGLVASLVYRPFVDTFLGGFFMLVGFGIVVAAIVFSLKISKNSFEKQKETLQKELENKKNEHEEAEQELLNNLAPHWDKIQSVVPQDYVFPLFVRTAYSYLINGRADDMKEAINLFEEEQYRWRMEENQKQMYEEYQTELRNLQEINNNLQHQLASAEYEARVAMAYATKDC